MSRRLFVLDASAVLCIVHREPGAEAVEAAMSASCISAVNLAEVLSRLVDRHLDTEAFARVFGETSVEVVPFDREHAERVAALRAATRARGLSLGDRACLALAAARGAIALTGDRAWADLDLGVQVELFR